MVLINNADIIRKLHSYYPNNRMPLLCAVYRSFGRRIISEDNEHEKGIRSEVYDMNSGGTTEDYLTCIALSEDGIAAIGSGNKNGCLYFIKDMSAVKDVESGDRFRPLHKEMLGNPIYSLDWTEDRLLVGLSNGATNLYKIEFNQTTLERFTLVGQYKNQPDDIYMHAPSYIPNTHVKSVEFATSIGHENKFLSTTKNQISVWNQDNANIPVYKIQANSAPLQCASWSPNEPQSLIVYGGYDRTLSIADTRMDSRQCVVWAAKNAHDRPITDAKFNTFIPYWLASSGEDSIVNIWDIRSSYRAPVAKVDGNIGPVTSIAWSSARPENLGTTTSDGTMRFWSLYPENFPLWDTVSRTSSYSSQDTLPIVRESEQNNIWCTKQQNYSRIEPSSWMNIWDKSEDMIETKSTIMLVGSMGLGSWGKMQSGFIYKGEKVVKPKGSPVAIKASKLRPSTYYSVSSGGQFVSHTIRFDTSSNIRYRHRFDPKDKDKLAAEIENDIYCRRITKAHKKLDQLKAEIKENEHEESYRKEAVTFLEDCLQLRDNIRESDWSFDSIPDKSNNRLSRRLWNNDEVWEHSINTFKRDLKYWSYRIPPGYNTHFKFPLDFCEPIIAERLIKEERIITEIPPLIEDQDSENEDNDSINASKTYSSKDSKIQNIETEAKMQKDETTRSSSNSVNTRKSSTLHRFELMDDEELKSFSAPAEEERDTSISRPIDNGKEDIKPVVETPNLATPPSSAPGIQKNIKHSHDPFETSVSAVKSTLSITNASAQDFLASKNPFESPKNNGETTATNPFESNFSKFDNEAPNNPFEKNDRSSDEIQNNRFGHRLGPSLSTQSEVNNSDKSSHRRHKFNVFKRFSRHKRNSSSSNEEQQQKHEDRIIERQSSKRRNAMHGPF